MSDYIKDLHKEEHLHFFVQEMRFYCIKLTKIFRFLCLHRVAYPNLNKIETCIWK